MRRDPAELIRILRSAGVSVSVHGERLCITAPRGFLTPVVREAIAKMKPQLREYLERTR